MTAEPRLPPDVATDLLMAEVEGREHKEYAETFGRLFGELRELKEELKKVEAKAAQGSEEGLAELWAFASTFMADVEYWDEIDYASGVVFETRVDENVELSAPVTAEPSDMSVWPIIGAEPVPEAETRAEQEEDRPAPTRRVVSLLISTALASVFLWTGSIAPLIESFPHRLFWWTMGFPAAGVAVANLMWLARGGRSDE